MLSVYDERDIIEVKLQGLNREEEEMTYQTPQWPIAAPDLKAIT